MSKDRCSGGMVYHYLVNDAKVRLFFQTKYEIAGFNKTLTQVGATILLASTKWYGRF